MEVASGSKIVVLGAGGVGKSALTLRLISDEYAQDYDPTIEDSYRKQVQIDNKPALLDVLDTAGQEEYSSLQDQWIREGDGYLLVYSITEQNSFDEVTNLYEKIVRIKDTEDFPLVIAGNKCDLENQRQVDRAAAQQQADDWNKAPLYETSAKTKINSTEVFYQVVREIRKRQVSTPEAKKKGFCTLL